MTAKQTAAKKRAARKKTATKKTLAAAKKLAAAAKRSRANGAAPIEVEIEDEATRFKLEALQLKLDNKRKEISDVVVAEFQQKANAAIDRKLRNDATFKKLNDEFQLLMNETAEELSPGDDYVAQNLNTNDGVFRYVPKQPEPEQP
ncbi:MAG: hypothetical protein GY769_20040 [bacterium]|nr:hypothetical protein [bacterium]